jgi:hypothetical protein
MVGTDQALYCELRGAGPWLSALSLACALLACRCAGEPDGQALGGAGLAIGPFPAACAARPAAPGSLRILAPGTEAAALAPLPLHWLPWASQMVTRVPRLVPCQWPGGCR